MLTHEPSRDAHGPTTLDSRWRCPRRRPRQGGPLDRLRHPPPALPRDLAGRESRALCHCTGERAQPEFPQHPVFNAEQRRCPCHVVGGAVCHHAPPAPAAGARPPPGRASSLPSSPSSAPAPSATGPASRVQCCTTPTTARHQDGDPFCIEIDQRIDRRYDINDTDTLTL